jgi:hypothetical protein
MSLEGHQRGACSPSRIKFKFFLKIVEFKLQRKIKIKINKQTNKLACHEKDTKNQNTNKLYHTYLLKRIENNITEGDDHCKSCTRK